MEGISNSTLVLRISTCVVGAKGVVLGGVCSAVFALYITGLLPGIGNIPPHALLIGGIVFTPNGILLLVLQVKKFAAACCSNDTYPSPPMPMRVEERLPERKSSSVMESSEQEEEMESEDLRIVDLPRELLDLIFSFLHKEEFISVKLVCSCFNQVLNAPFFTKKLGKDVLKKAWATSNALFAGMQGDGKRVIRLNLRLRARNILLHDTKSNRKKFNRYRRKIVKQSLKGKNYLTGRLCVRELVKMGFYKEAWRTADKLINRILEEKPMLLSSRVTFWYLCETLVLSIEKMAAEGREEEALKAYRKLLSYRENEILHPEMKDEEIVSAAIAVGDLDLVRNIIREDKNRINFLLTMIKIFHADRTEENWQVVIDTARDRGPSLKKLKALIFLARTTGETELLSYELRSLGTYIKRWSNEHSLYNFLLEAYFHLNENEKRRNIFEIVKENVLSYLENNQFYDKSLKKTICKFVAVCVHSGMIHETEDLLDEIKVMIEQSQRGSNSQNLRDIYEASIRTFNKATRQLGENEYPLTEEKDLAMSPYHQTKLLLNHFDQYLVPKLKESQESGHIFERLRS